MNLFQLNSLNMAGMVFHTGGFSKPSVGYGLEVRTGAIKFYAKTTPKYHALTYGQPGALNAWFHISTSCLDLDTNGCTMYINGCQVPTKVQSQARSQQFTGFQNFKLGDWHLNSYSKVNLAMDEFILWEDGLTDAQMWQVYAKYA